MFPPLYCAHIPQTAIILFLATTDIFADISEKVVPFLGDQSEVKEFANQTPV